MKYAYEIDVDQSAWFDQAHDQPTPREENVMVQIGAALPVMGSDISAESLAAVAEAAERMGLGSLWANERLLRPIQPIPMGGEGGPIMEAPEQWGNTYDPIEALTYVAARTERILLGTSVMVGLFQSPVMLARRLATLDQLSGGRLLAGIGQGWMAEEFDAAGVPMSRRGAGFEEQFQAMRAVWGPNPVRFKGRFYSIPECDMGPKPVRPDGPTVLVGGGTPAAIERAARLGFGLATVVFSWDALRDTVAAFRQAATAAGHDADRLPVTVQVNGPISATPQDGERAPLTGSVEQVADDLLELDRMGIDHVFWMLLDIDEQLDILARLTAAYAERRG